MTRRRDPLVIQADAIARQIDDVRSILPATVAWWALQVADGWPHRGETAGRGGATLSTVEAATIARTTGTGSGYGIADRHEAIAQALAVAAGQLHEVITLLRGQAPPVTAQLGDRCSGRVDPTCTELAASTSERGGLCARCIPSACRRCWSRPAEARRSPVSHEPCCEACYRRELRAGAA